MGNLFGREGTIKWFWGIKEDCTKPFFISLPDNKGRFLLYSDISKFYTGSALCDIHNGKPQLKAHAGKRMPEAVRHYSVTEIEFCW